MLRSFLCALLLSGALALTAATAPSALADGLDVVRVQKVDGTVVPGFIVEKRADGLLVRSGEGDVFIPWVEISEVEHITSPVEPAPIPEEARPKTQRPARGLKVAPPVEVDLRSSPGWPAYDAGRIRLVDHRGKPIGPSWLGYSARDFGRNDDERYHARRGGEYLTIRQFIELSDNEKLLDKWQRELDKAQAKIDVGIGMIALSAGLGGVGLPMAFLGASAGDFNAQLAAPGLIGWSIATLVIAASLHKSGFGRMAEFNDVDFDEFMDRPDLWPYVQEFNSKQRAAAGLPDDEKADAP